ncbi:acyltransferase family protein [Parapusillimonas granuli]|uniref:Acyltransferase n=1 Tax=Parapusillimonas granuli TaxID=380911 RepID=A0A853G4H3_9BURK|nr:acyltransferase family protein [Parapusillimonas granuli]MBB5217617.1 peptidoglycan/LPS O-acetylase OafA/YrhL [Parapusillimonas granuli]NYT49621.1 acyltransferase [Parapusillimonas granuli]
MTITAAAAANSTDGRPASHHVSDIATHPAYRPDIDGLRAVAVLGVLVYHAFPQALAGGFAGVDVFFVISGFLITTILLKSFERGAFSLLDFYARRILRLFPVLVVVLLFSLLAGAFVFLPSDYEKLAVNTLGGVAFIANILFATDTGYFAGIAESNPVLHLWSLGIEEQFYVVWPLLLFAIFRRSIHMGWTMAVLIAVSFLYSVYLVEVDRSWAFYSPLSRFWELGAGGLLAYLMQYPKPAMVRALLAFNASFGFRKEREAGEVLRHLASLIGLALVTASFFILSPSGVFPGLGALMPVLGSVLLIAAGPRAAMNRLLLSRHVMVGIGLISYPLYLWHWPLLALAANANSDGSYVATRNLTLAMVSLSFLLAWLSYRYIEKPLRQRGTRAGKVASLSLAMTATAVAACSIWMLQGAPQRLPAELRDELATGLRDEAWMAGLRRGICHNMIYSGKGLGERADCFPDGHPSIMLWGDSHAASLRVGLDALRASEPFAIWQYTTDATAPLFTSEMFNNMKRPLSFVNGAVLDTLRVHAPDTILLHAVWRYYLSDANRMADLLEEAVRVIHQAAPDSRIVVLGPIPVWRAGLQQILFNYYWRHGATPAGERISFGLLPSLQEFDAVLEARMRHANVPYISAMKELCNEAGCLIRTGPGRAGIMYVDDQHLSASGSKYLAQKILPRLLGKVSGAE